MQSEKANLLLLATLLHDVGKFYRYSENLSMYEGVKYQHVKGSLAFVDDLFEGRKYFDIDIEKLKYLIANHHSNVDDIYIKILKSCDEASALERGEEDEDTTYRRRETPLEHPLGVIMLNQPSGESERKYLLTSRVSDIIKIIKEAHVDESALDIYKIILKNRNEADARTYYSTDNYRSFIELCKKARESGDFKIFFNNLSLVMFDFLKFLPSDVTSERGRMISLYDHLKISSALVNTKELTSNEYTLINIEIGNIQNFISMYLDYEKATKEATKILRGRSLFISLLSKIISIYLQRELNLNTVNELMNSAGNILFIAPKLSNEEKEKIIKTLEEFFIEQLDGNLTVVVCMKDIKGEQITDLEKFSEVVKSLKEIIEEEKSRRFRRSLELFAKKNQDQNAITSKILCKSCGKELEQVKGELKCEFCDFLINLGGESVRDSFLGFLIEVSNEKRENARFSLRIGDKCYNIRFINEENYRQIPSKDTYLVFNIQKLPKILDLNSDLSSLLSRTILIPMFEIPYVPKIKDRNIEMIMPIASSMEESNIMMELAQVERKAILENIKVKIGDIERKISLNKLSLCYFDLDNLGKIMYDYESILKDGYKVLIYDKTTSKLKTISYKLKERYSISLWSTISFFISFFFSTIVNKLAEKYNIYIIFSGGDDLKAFGSPHEMIHFVSELLNEFKNYFDNKFSFSGSIILSDDEIPILKLVGVLESLEKSAKNYSSTIGIENIKGFIAINNEKNILPYVLLEEQKDVYTKILELYVNKNLTKTALHRIYRLLKSTIDIRPELLKENIEEVRFYYGFSKLEYFVSRNVKKMRDEERKNLIEYLFKKEIPLDLSNNVGRKYYRAMLYMIAFTFAYLVMREI